MTKIKLLFSALPSFIVALVAMTVRMYTDGSMDHILIPIGSVGLVIGFGLSWLANKRS